METLLLKGDATVWHVHSVETDEGLRTVHDNLTDSVRLHWHCELKLDNDVTLATVMELLLANPSMANEFYHCWVHQYMAHYQQLKEKGLVQFPPVLRPVVSFNLDPDNPKAEPQLVSIGLTRIVEFSLSPKISGVLRALMQDDAPTSKFLAAFDSEQQAPSIGWSVFGVSQPLACDCTLHEVQYTAGEVIKYSISMSFDKCINLPIRMAPGRISLCIQGDKRKHRKYLDIESEPAGISLFQFLREILYDFSFHGGPDQTEETRQKLMRQVEELPDITSGKILSYGMAHAFWDDIKLDNPEMNDQRARILQSENFLTKQQAATAAGVTEEAFDSQWRQRGMVFSLRASATSFCRRQEKYPAFQFNPLLDRDALKTLIWKAANSCSFWVLFDFLKSYQSALPRYADGISVLTSLGKR